MYVFAEIDAHDLSSKSLSCCIWMSSELGAI